MTKTKKNSLFLVVIALLLAAISAALIFTAAPKRVNAEEKAVPTAVEKTKEEIKQEKKKEFLEFLEKADQEELSKNAAKNRSVGTIDSSAYSRITEGVITTLYGKVIVIDGGDVFGNFDNYTGEYVPFVFNSLNENNYLYIGIEPSDITIAIYCLGIDSDPALYFFGYGEFEYGDPFGDLEGSNYFAYSFPESVTTINNQTIDLTTTEFAISVSESESAGVYWYELSETPTEPTEPEQPDNPSDNPTETDTNGNKPFDLGAWLTQAGEDVSEWIGEIVGIATSGSTVLIVGAVIIVIVIARRRRR